MKIINEPRGAGKTTKLVEWLKSAKKQHPKCYPIIITFSATEAKRLQVEYDLRPDQVMSWHQYQQRVSGINEVLALDNADMILEDLVHSKIDIITITKHDELENKTN